MPSTVAFLTSLPSNLSCRTVTPPYYTYLGGFTANGGVGPILNTIFDIGGNFFPGNGAGNPARFTAPVNGNYWLIFNANLTAPGGLSAQELTLSIQTTTKTYSANTALLRGANKNIWVTAKAAMSAGDTAVFAFSSLGDLTRIISGANALTPITWVAGYLM